MKSRFAASTAIVDPRYAAVDSPKNDFTQLCDKAFSGRADELEPVLKKLENIVTSDPSQITNGSTLKLAYLLLRESMGKHGVRILDLLGAIADHRPNLKSWHSFIACIDTVRDHGDAGRNEAVSKRAEQLLVSFGQKAEAGRRIYQEARSSAYPLGGRAPSRNPMAPR